MGSFACGDADLDEFIREDALMYERCDTARVHVAVVDGQVVGYIALLSDAVILRTDERKKLQLTCPSKTVPAIKIGRLAVDQEFKRKTKGLGTALVRHAFHIALKARKDIGCRLLSVDAYIESVGFYDKLKFVRNRSKDNDAADEPASCAPPRTMSMRLDLNVDPLPDWAM